MNCHLHLPPGMRYCLLFIVCQAVSAGCSPSPATPSASDAPPTSSSAGETTAPAAEDEYWEVFYIEGEKVGRSHTIRQIVTEQGEPRIRTSSSSILHMQRFGQQVVQQIRLVSTTDLSGQLRSFVTEVEQPPVKMTTRGAVRDGRLEMETESLGQKQTTSLPWDEQYGGLFADQHSLRTQPMKPGEQRTIRALVPLFNQLGTIELQAADEETTSLLSGSAKLLRVESKLQLGDSVIRSVYWADEQGIVHKSSTSFSGFEQVAYRVDRRTALEPATSPQRFDLGSRSAVRVAEPLENPHDTQRVIYRARLEEGDPAVTFVHDGTQEVERVDAHTARITVHAVDPDSPLAAPSTPPGAGDREPNSLIQSDDPQVVAMAQAVAASDDDPWALAQALEEHVHQTVDSKTFSQALASAADVVRSREGDCTEHAVLLAAVCRARKLPARVAIGLVYFPAAQAFAYHMWNEVWIRDRWIPLDATLGRGGIGAAHLKVATSDLRGATPYAALLPVLELLGRLELEIEEVHHAAAPAPTGQPE